MQNVRLSELWGVSQSRLVVHRGKEAEVTELAWILKDELSTDGQRMPERHP